MRTPKRFDPAIVIILSRSALFGLILCSGCLRHRTSIEEGYRIDDKSGVTMLVPMAAQSVSSAEFQTVMVTLPADSSREKEAMPGDCMVDGRVFSIHPTSSAKDGSWLIRTPSTAGWSTLSGEIDIDAQWRLFIRELARMYDRRCFPSGLTAQSIRTAIAKRIPLPASQVPIFTYSDQGERHVDLAPGMEIRIQRVVPTLTSAPSPSANSIQISTAVYDVVSRRDGGVALRRDLRAERQEKASSATEDPQLAALNQRFARTSVLRLFLQGFSGRESQSGAILVGATNATQLDSLTDLLRKNEAISCVNLPGAICMDFPPGSISLFSFVWLNGRRTTCPFGTSLASLIFRLPEPKQAKALESVMVSRQLRGDLYATVQITRTVEGASQVLLLPGDRIEWKN